MGKKRNDQTTIKEQIKVNDGESIFPNFLYYTFGYGISIVFGLAFAIYLRDLHEVTLFFSNIRKIEQEISLRTESGLYYSYFKEILQKPTIALGIQALLNDTRTEYPRAINILERFNVYQEVLLAILYRAYDFNLAPMLFYVYWCFAFAGLQVFAIFHLSWTLSKSVAFPVLACSWLFYNLDETTRAYFSVNLRENFSLPFLFLQTVFLCQLLIKQKNFMACGVGYVMAILASHVLYKGKKLIGLSNAKVLAIAIAFSLLYAQYGVYKEQMTNEQEFFDEDTVDLMLWIGWQRRDAVFTGSMQLMAGVKACTGRNILNHPHFEDQWIRNRTKRLYSIYGRKSIKRVHQILKKEKADFVIIEDSICLAPSTGCSTNDLVDFASGLLPDNGLTKFGKNLKEKISEERFCEAIRSPDPSLERYFILEHSNPTFRVYKINHDD
uniref:C-mannosyltransferase DPY19L3 n=1 Tax=Rhabditophanes sp. KR3021 TaxID=114890 RepID=A0AC35TIR6_9BILA